MKTPKTNHIWPLKNPDLNLGTKPTTLGLKKRIFNPGPVYIDET